MKSRPSGMTVTSISRVTVLLISSIALSHAREDRFTTLDFPSPGVTDTEATALTPSGVIVGRYITPEGAQHGFVLKDGKYKTLDVPGGNTSDAAWINASGDIVGTYHAGFGNAAHAYVLSRGKLTTIDFPSATPLSTIGFGISNGGDVVGVVTPINDFLHGHGYLFSHGTFTLVDVPDAVGTFPTMVTDSGRIVGAYFDKNSTFHGFQLRGGEFTTIDFPNSTFTWITGIGTEGDIVGFYNSKDGKQHGFILTAGGFISINIPGAISTESNGIDPQGNVVGRYTTPDGRTHGYFLPEAIDGEPIPTACTL